ncbi:type II secretion system minor pseudopilin GspI [Alkalilimnicola sp. S0819]|uniref:type II secretion system minor pseudopilin GspI n=1 Tax=Alkalilimnicola sp. S0819 TaxID=2613922 RepID=UPI0012625EAE|nr:type II secretion system minor pseudopilin GspI [Alkalilimnicola sp. S0819]KAB7622991.1 type II secretion system protein GspI [Alkalilimnicola sp. S0819]MPQ17101.1 type II secretion system protein GspI [Alkalilimnicola sp. S0819]
MACWTCKAGANERGFTLLEVLIAVAILAIALGAVIKSVTAHTANGSYLRERSFAHWVATDRLAELRLEERFDTGRESGRTEMADREWPWRIEIEETPNDNVRRVRVTVYSPENDDNQLASLTGFLENPQLRDAAAAPAQQEGGQPPEQGEPPPQGQPEPNGEPTT